MTTANSQLRASAPAEQPATAAQALPADSAWLFPEYDFSQIELQEYRGVIIERILEKGSPEQLKWLFRIYGEPTVADWVRQHGFRLLSKRSFALWRLALGITEFHAPEWALPAKAESPW